MPEISDILKRGWLSSFTEAEARIRLYAAKAYRGLLSAYQALGCSPECSSPDDLIQQAFDYVVRNQKAYDPSRFKPYEFWRRQISHVAKAARARAAAATGHLKARWVQLVSSDQCDRTASSEVRSDYSSYQECQQDFIRWLTIYSPGLVDIAEAMFRGNETVSDLAAEFGKSTSWASLKRQALQAACSAFLNQNADAESGHFKKSKETK